MICSTATPSPCSSTAGTMTTGSGSVSRRSSSVGGGGTSYANALLFFSLTSGDGFAWLGSTGGAGEAGAFGCSIGTFPLRLGRVREVVPDVDEDDVPLTGGSGGAIGEGAIGGRTGVRGWWAGGTVGGAGDEMFSTIKREEGRPAGSTIFSTGLLLCAGVLGGGTSGGEILPLDVFTTTPSSSSSVLSSCDGDCALGATGRSITIGDVCTGAVLAYASVVSPTSTADSPSGSLNIDCMNLSTTTGVASSPVAGWERK